MAIKPFTGFPEKAEVTPLPNLFITGVMPQIQDVAELKAVLHIFWLLSRRRGYPRLVTYSELVSDSVLMGGMGQEIESSKKALQQALISAVQHGILLSLHVERDGKSDDAYFINTAEGKRTVDRINQGEIQLADLSPVMQNDTKPLPPSDIFSLYEQNIGIITPMIAEELKDAEKSYPVEWIESAFREAVALNKRSWKYIARILERWEIEGKDDGKLRRDFKKGTDPDKYIKGRYGHMVKR